MHPIVFTIPWVNRDIPAFGLMMMIGFFASILWAARRAQRSGANPDVILNCGFIALIAGVVGARGMYVVHYWNEFHGRGGWLEVLAAVIDVTRGGLEFYGGFLASVVGVVAYLVLWKHSLRWYLDIVAPSAALGLAFGRVGCFLNGCCWGAVCDHPWAVTFPFGSNAAAKHWQERLPGAELPKELLFEIDDTGLFQPILRESLAARDEAIAAAQQSDDLLVELEAMKKQRSATVDPAALAALDDGIRDRERRLDAARKAFSQHHSSMGCTAGAAERSFRDIREPMRKYGRSAAEIRALAAQHRSLPVHPTQLYSVITAGLVAATLSAMYWRRARDGQVICSLLVIEPVGRWLIERIRDDNPVDTFGGLFTISQSIALGLTLAGVIGLFVVSRLPARSPRAVLWVPEPEPVRMRGGGGRRPDAAHSG